MHPHTIFHTKGNSPIVLKQLKLPKQLPGPVAPVTFSHALSGKHPVIGEFVGCGRVGDAVEGAAVGSFASGVGFRD
eukprot:scaffold1588_cov214-Alexandrium_tamarense.AAC.26